MRRQTPHPAAYPRVRGRQQQQQGGGVQIRLGESSLSFEELIAKYPPHDTWSVRLCSTYNEPEQTNKQNECATSVLLGGGKQALPSKTFMQNPHTWGCFLQYMLTMCAYCLLVVAP